MIASRTVLRAVPLFASLPDADLDLVRQSSRQVKYPAHSVVFHEGDPGDFLLVLLAGRAKVSLLGESGHEITLRYMRPPTFLGELALLDGSPRSATVTTVEKTTFLKLGREDFLGLMQRSEALMTRTLQHLTACLRDATEHIRSLSMYDVHGRLVRALLQLSHDRGIRRRTRVVIDAVPSQRELGEMVNCSRETVSRGMKALVEAGYISIEQAGGGGARPRRLVVTERALRHYWPQD